MANSNWTPGWIKMQSVRGRLQWCWLQSVVILQPLYIHCIVLHCIPCLILHLHPTTRTPNSCTSVHHKYLGNWEWLDFYVWYYCTCVPMYDIDCIHCIVFRVWYCTRVPSALAEPMHCSLNAACESPHSRRWSSSFSPGSCTMFKCPWPQKTGKTALFQLLG